MIRAISVCLLLLVSCAVRDPVADRSGGEDRLLTLRTYLCGSFSSETQAQRDGSYYHIALHATQMWTWRDDGPWLYVEQSLAANASQPYRQRVYKLERTPDGRYWSRVFVIPNAMSYAGAWKSGSPLSELSPADLEERVGCAITLTWDESTKTFSGGTTGTGCPSELAGAAYATSLVTLAPDRMVTWDRGFDATAQQVWGATEAGYEFVRID